jgi:integrase
MAKRAAPGEGRPYQRSQDGRWVVAVPVQAADGRRRRRFLYGWSRAEVLGKLDELRAATRMGMAPPDHRLTVGRHLSGWLEAVRPTVRPSTWVSYEGHVRMHLAELHPIAMTRLAPNDVRRLRTHLLAAHLAPRSVGYTMTVLRMALRQAVRDGLIPRNVAELVPAPRIERAEMQTFTPDEARRFLAATADDPHAALWAILIGLGLRLGEGLGLRWSDVDLAGGSVSIARSLRPTPKAFRDGGPRLELVEPKTPQGWRTIALPGFALEALLRHRASSKDLQAPVNLRGLVFTTPRGTPLDPRNVNRRFGAILEEAALPRIRLHDLRHTAASLMLARGYTLEDVKRVFGHASIVQTSNSYGHLVEGRSREIADGMQAILGGS